MGVSKNSGTPKSSILIGFSTINHPFWGTPIFGNTQISQLKSFFSSPAPVHVDILTLPTTSTSFRATNGDVGVPWDVCFFSILATPKRRNGKVLVGCFWFFVGGGWLGGKWRCVICCLYEKKTFDLIETHVTYMYPCYLAGGSFREFLGMFFHP